MTRLHIRELSSLYDRVGGHQAREVTAMPSTCSTERCTTIPKLSIPGGEGS